MKKIVITAAIYLLIVRWFRYKNLVKNQSLDPTNLQDAAKIVKELFYREFPFAALKSLDFGFFKTYSIPTISKLLVATGEFKNRASKRYNDTSLLMRECCERSITTQRGDDAVKRITEIHSKYPIRNQDYLYTLGVFIFEPLRWIDKYEWRKTDPIEKVATFTYFKEIGIRMGIKDIPETMEEMEAFYDSFEASNMSFSPSNALVAKYTMDLLLSVYPWFLHGVARRCIYAFMEKKQFTDAMGFPAPSPFLLTILKAFIYLRAYFIRYLCLPRASFYCRTPEKMTDGVYIPNYCEYGNLYAQGYTLSDLGPNKL